MKRKRTALVTGSSRGIGRGIAAALAEAGMTVAVHYHERKDEAEGTLTEIKNKGGSGAVFTADLNNEAGARGLIRRVEKRFGRMDVLVNNYGPIQVKHWGEFVSEEWDFLIKANLFTALWCMTAVLPGMRKRKWGRIINIGYNRVEQLRSFATITPYAVAKTGLLILTRSAAVKAAPDGITVNMVSPGLMESGVNPDSAQVPMGRLGRFRDIAHAVSFLASDESDYITGTNLMVAGGWKL
jgi:3-oxoacyl-[acyl-carrier protein] reductase